MSQNQRIAIGIRGRVQEADYGGIKRVVSKLLDGRFGHLTFLSLLLATR
jgi:hypothetical protein